MANHYRWMFSFWIIHWMFSFMDSASWAEKPRTWRHVWTIGPAVAPRQTVYSSCFSGLRVSQHQPVSSFGSPAFPLFCGWLVNSPLESFLPKLQRVVFSLSRTCCSLYVEHPCLLLPASPFHLLPLSTGMPGPSSLSCLSRTGFGQCPLGSQGQSSKTPYHRHRLYIMTRHCKYLFTGISPLILQLPNFRFCAF